MVSPTLAAAWRDDVVRMSAAATALLSESTGPAAQAGAPAASVPAVRAAAARPRLPVSPGVLRVFQLDAERIDTEVFRILWEHLASACSAFGDAAYFGWKEELALGLRLVLFKLGVWDANQSYGEALQNVVYRNERAARAAGFGAVLTAFRSTRPTRLQLLAKLALSVLLPYAFAKAQRRAADDAWESRPEGDAWRRLAVVLRRLETAVEVMRLVNFAQFLAFGRFRSLSDALLGLRLVYGRQRMAKVVNLSYLLQQLQYTALFSMLAVVLPMLNLGRLWSLAGSFRAQPETATAALGGGDRCPICASPSMAHPRRGSCGCLFCYYCAASRTADGRSFGCPRCGKAVTGVLPAATVRS